MATDKAVDTVELSCIVSEFYAANCIIDFTLGNCRPTFSSSRIFTRLIRSYHEGKKNNLVNAIILGFT